jgi:exodeoxyribonuclease V beta subunit
MLHCDAERQGIAGLLGWLAEKRRAPAKGNEAELLRLESDENLVKLFTVHAAKGLEFPLVFCPFAWDGGFRTGKDDVVAFHDPADNYSPVIDFGSAARDAARPQATREDRAESLRLLYVALTRAKYRCSMVWGDVNGAAEAAPAWLLHRRGAADEPQLAGMSADLARLAQESGGRIRVMPLPDASLASALVRREETPPEPPRRFDGVVRDTRSVTSFTALAHGRSVEAPDYDAAEREPLAESVKGRDIFAFPRGAQAGRCIHAIFENVDFARAKRPQIDGVVAQALKAHGFEAVWAPAVAGMVESVLSTPLDGSGMRLSQVARERRLDELEFYYPIHRLADAPLRSILTAHAFPDEIRERIGALTFDRMDGYMRGFIDLVFEHGGRYYLIDYKSNWLGPTPDAYNDVELARAMGREAYYLQYLVYCVALHRYLATRLDAYSYASHFGGVRYLFVRAMREDRGTRGVYIDRPAESLVGALDAYFRTGAT